MTVPSDKEVENFWSPRQRGTLGWGAGEGACPAWKGLEGKGGGEAGAEMISFPKPESSQSAHGDVMSPPTPPPFSLGSPTENSRQALN